MGFSENYQPVGCSDVKTNWKLYENNIMINNINTTKKTNDIQVD